MNKFLLGLLALVLLTLPGSAQQAVKQSGNVSAGHPPVWVAPGIIGDGGTAASGFLTSLGVTNNGGPGICVNSGSITGPYNQICLAATTNGGTKISSYAVNGATSPGITFDINGALQGFPVVSGLPTTANGPPCFSGVSGSLQPCNYTTHGVLIGQNAAPLTTVGPCTNGAFIGGTGGTTDPTCQSFLQSGTGAIARTWQDKAQDFVNYKDFNPTLDCTTDDSTALQNAVNALPNGGIVYTPDKQFCSAIASTVTVRKGVLLLGPGKGHAHGIGSDDFVAKFKWTGSGGGTMFDMSPVTGAGAQRIGGGGIVGVGLYGQHSGGIGLNFRSVRDGVVDVYIEGWTTTGVNMNVVTPLGESASTQNNDITVFGNQTNSADGEILTLDGGTNDNTSFNRIIVFGQMLNGIGVHVKNADNNVFRQIRLFQNPGGTAAALVRCDANASVTQTCRNNQFSYVNAQADGANKSITFQGTESAANPSTGNIVGVIDVSNGTQAPTLGTGVNCVSWINNSTSSAIQCGTFQIGSTQTLRTDDIATWKNANTTVATFGGLPGVPSIVGFWLGNATPGDNDFNILGGAGQTFINAGSGGQILFRINNVSSPNAMQIAASTGVSIGTNTDAGSTNFLVAGTTTTKSVVTGANGGTSGAVKFFGSTSGDVTIKAAAAAGTATNFQLPATNGSNTNFLQTDGSGNTSWQPASATSGNRVLINTLTASNSATLADTTSFTSTYNRYEIVFQDIISVTNSVALRLRYNVGGVQTTGYLSSQSGAQAGVANSEAQTTYIPISFAANHANTAPGLQATLTLYGDPTTTVKHQISGLVTYRNSANQAVTVQTEGLYDTTGALTGIEVSESSGNISSGTVKIFGIVN